MAYWLCSQRKMTGALWMPAKFIASCVSPTLVAPSPNVTSVTSSFPWSFEAQATPTACGSCVATGAEPETMRSRGSLKCDGMLRPPLLTSSARESRARKRSRGVWPMVSATPMSR